MTLNDLLPELLKLNHDDMVQIIEILQHEVSHDRAVSAEPVYEVWAPQITPESAHILAKMLEEDRRFIAHSL